LSFKKRATQAGIKKKTNCLYDFAIPNDLNRIDKAIESNELRNLKLYVRFTGAVQRIKKGQK